MSFPQEILVYLLIIIIRWFFFYYISPKGPDRGKISLDDFLLTYVGIFDAGVNTYDTYGVIYLVN